VNDSPPPRADARAPPSTCATISAPAPDLALILLKSVAEFPSKPFGAGGLQKTFSFIGDPVFALLAGMLLSLTLIRRREDVKEGFSTSSMVVSHANDSFFWVVSQFSDLEVNTAYKVYTSATAIEGGVAFAAAWVMSFFV